MFSIKSCYNIPLFIISDDAKNRVKPGFLFLNRSKHREACKEQSLRQIATCVSSSGVQRRIMTTAESLKCPPPSREAGEDLTPWSHLRIGSISQF